MLPHAIRHRPGCFALAVLLMAPLALAMDAAAFPAATADAMAQVASPQAIAEYRRKLREYQEARAAFEQEASAYWSSIAEKRRGRNAKRRERQTIALDDYVLTQPPVYTGPKPPGGSAADAVRAGGAAPAQNYSGRRRSLKSRRGAFSVYPAAAHRRDRVQARLCPRRSRGGADAGAGGAGLFVRDRRQRQPRHAIGVECLAAGLARDLDRDRLQPAAHHQQRRIDRRAGLRIRPGADGKGRAIVRRAAPGDGPQDCG